MIKLERILLATDFSQFAEGAKDFACELADRFHAELHVLHVIDDSYSQVPDFGMGLAFPAFLENLPARREKQELEAMRMSSELIDADFEKENRVTIATRFGSPFHEIVTYADEHFIDLIVIGTHGRTGVAHAILGSVAEKVVRKAHCPVLTIRPEEIPASDASQVAAASSN